MTRQAENATVKKKAKDIGDVTMLYTSGSSPALLPEWAATLTTRSGLRLNVRPASPDDEQELMCFFAKTTPDDLRFRFLSSLKTVGPALAHQLLDVDHRRTENLLAFDAADGRLAATAMIAADERLDEAEVAVIVRSDLKGKGVGWTMLSHACDYARARGLGELHSVELSQNRAAISLEEQLGFTVRQHPDDASLTIVTKSL